MTSKGSIFNDKWVQSIVVLSFVIILFAVVFRFILIRGAETRAAAEKRIPE